MYDLAKCLSIVIVTHQYLQVVNEWGFLTSPHHGLVWTGRSLIFTCKIIIIVTYICGICAMQLVGVFVVSVRQSR